MEVQVAAHITVQAHTRTVYTPQLVRARPEDGPDEGYGRGRERGRAGKQASELCVVLLLLLIVVVVLLLLRTGRCRPCPPRTRPA